MSALLRVALLQMLAHGADQDANLVKGEEYCRLARDMGADVALFPEMWNVGCGAWPDEVGGPSAWAAQAVSADDPFIKHFVSLAQELDMAIALTYLERCDGGPRNSISVIDRHGEVALTYAKVHTCDFDAECSLTPGEEFPVSALDTAAGGVSVGAMICYDREFPESARVLMLQGAEIVLVPNACELEQNRLSQIRARAFENMIGIAVANYTGAEGGHSVALDGMAFEERGGSRDMILVEAGPEEGVYVAQFDLDALRAYRARETWGNAFRKPRTYGALTAPDVRPPFVRSEARR
jgi:N-carbamoylputrescine amidase